LNIGSENVLNQLHDHQVGDMVESWPLTSI